MIVQGLTFEFGNCFHYIGIFLSAKDVREMAEALTGITFNLDNGLEFQLRRAEPGAEVVLAADAPAGTAVSRPCRAP